MKRQTTFSILITLCFMAFFPLSADAAVDTWDGGADTAWYYADTTATSYTITTAEQLAGLAQLINDDGTVVEFEDKTITLAADLDLGGSAHPWTPIGYSSGGSNFFRGTFDGGEHKITGLYINDTSGYNVGLFGHMTEGTIKNISVAGSVTGRGNTGGVVGLAYGNIINCHNSATIENSGKSYAVGGVVGSFGHLTSQQYVMINCSNTGDILATGVNDTPSNIAVGGVAGIVRTEDLLINCYNSGAVTATETGTKIHVGGVVGWNVVGTVQNSYNIGAVSGGSFRGGVVGTSGSYSESSNVSTVTNSYYLAGKGATTVVGGELYETTAPHVGSFESPTSAITIESIDGVAGGSIPISTLFDALAAGKTAYNNTSPTDKAQDMSVRPGENNGYPVYVTYWKDYAQAPTDGNIDSPEKLAWLIVNGVTSSETYTVTQNINLSERMWTPITRFYGTLNGGGNTIEGMIVYAPSSDKQGLLETGGAGSTVQNVLLYGSVTGRSAVGGVVGENSASKIENCTSYVTVTGNVSVGGIAGENEGSIINGISYATVTGNVSVGGVVGRNFKTGTVKGSSYLENTVLATYKTAIVGGVVGNNSGLVIDCHNAGTVSTTGDVVHIGGVVGDNSGTVQNNYNVVSISATGDSSFVGGIVGHNNKNVINNYNSGDVSSVGSSSSVGGVVGSNINPDATITNNYSIGTVSATGEASNAGGVTGENGGSVTNNYYLTNNGVSKSIGDDTNTDTTKNVGSFTSPTSVITIEGTASDGISTTNLLEALNAGRVAYNTANPTAQQAKEWLSGKNINNGYPFFAIYWSDFAKQPTDNQITTAEELAWLIDNHDSGSYTLTKDIDLSGRIWTPIGSFGYGNGFDGTFDGAGHKISGMYINTATGDYQGLFGAIYLDGVVQNVTVGGSVTGDEDVGGVVGDNNGIVDNCHNTATVAGNNAVGGVVGRNSSLVIGCSNSGDISATGSSANVGGVVGNNVSTIINSHNSGNISSTGDNDNVGGISGNSYGNVRNSYNSGDISATGNGVNIGGLVGRIDADDRTVRDCYNIGDISVTDSSSNIGGLVGYLIEGTLKDSYYLKDGEVTGVGAVNESSEDNTDISAVITNIGSFSSPGSEIKIDAGITADENLTTTNLLSALNAGAEKINENASISSISWIHTPGENDDYPVHMSYWRDVAVEPKNGEIKTPQELAWLIYNHGTGSYTLAEDIDLSGRIWTPIGSENNGFAGTFNGNSGKVSGIYIVDKSSNYQGLFGYINTAGVVQNVGVEGGVTGKNYVGGVAGYNDGTVNNCYNVATVTGYNNVGGVVGENHSGTVANCYNIGTLSITDDTGWLGGVVGSNDGRITNCYYLTDKGATKGVGSGFTSRYQNVGSFSSADSSITLDSGISNPDNIPHESLLTALNAGAMAYNASVTDVLLKAHRWEIVADSAYPVIADGSLFGDVNNDLFVDEGDLRAIAGESYNTIATPKTAHLDVNGDGVINFADLALVRNSRYFEK